MPGSALKIETTRRQLAVASGCLPGLVDSARYRRRFWSDFRPACRLSGSAGARFTFGLLARIIL